MLCFSYFVLGVHILFCAFLVIGPFLCNYVVMLVIILPFYQKKGVWSNVLMHIGFTRNIYFDPGAGLALFGVLKMYGTSAIQLVKEIANSEKGQLTAFSVRENRLVSHIYFSLCSLIWYMLPSSCRVICSRM